jgi:hypothetical protein
MLTAEKIVYQLPSYQLGKPDYLAILPAPLRAESIKG